MKLHFFKYQATGNDFVLVDNRSGSIQLSLDQIKRICDRRFGVGADGFILLEKHPSLDFDLIYFNSDGSQSLCGNGTRAAIKMASSLGMINGKATFNAFDGKHQAELFQNGIVKVRMNDVSGVKQLQEDWIIYTGSPHFIRFVKNLNDYPVVAEGKKIRYSESFQPGGTNVNFVELLPNNTIFVRTYERGVEDETLSCGTGVTAAALAAHFKQYTSPVLIQSLGGDLSVEFKVRHTDLSHRPLPDQFVPGREGSGHTVVHADIHDGEAGQAGAFHDIFLVGPAKMVFEGDLEL